MSVHPSQFVRRAPRFSSRRPYRPAFERLEERNLLTTFFGGYRTLDTLYADLASVTATYPGITELVDYGDSYSKEVGGVTTPGGQTVSGYDLLAVRVTNRAVPGPKPVFFIQAGLHAREISTPEVALRLLDSLTQGYGANADATWLVDHHEVWIVPVANPDGRWYVELGTQPPFGGRPWEWRKNGHPNTCRTWPAPSGSGYGVDLNRNFDDHWGVAGSSADPCSATYRGTARASEPEVAALQNLMRTIIPDQRGPSDSDPAPEGATGIFIDVHTYGGLVLWPWGHTAAAPPNGAGLTAIGGKLASFNGYEAGQLFQTLYPAAGTAKGWAYGELGIPAYTFELDSGTFLAPYGTVDSRLWPQNRDAFLYAAKIARTPYLTVRGPDVGAVLARQEDSRLVVTAQVDDTGSGRMNLVAAEFYVDTPPWMEGAVPRFMKAADGTFDSPREDVYSWRTIADLKPGRHLIYVRGQDAGGNWGPFSAAFVDLEGASVAGRSDEGARLANGMRIEAQFDPFDEMAWGVRRPEKERALPTCDGTVSDLALLPQEWQGTVGDDRPLGRDSTNDRVRASLEEEIAIAL